MGIEVRQLVINSTVEEDSSSEPKTTAQDPEASSKTQTASESSGADGCSDLEQMKADVLQECRRMILDFFNHRRER